MWANRNAKIRWAGVYVAVISVFCLPHGRLWAELPAGRVTHLEPLPWPAPDAEFPPAGEQPVPIDLRIPGTGAPAMPPDRASWITPVNLLQEPAPPSEGAVDMGAELLDRGRASFNAYCIDCHDAERSLSRTKSFSAWLATVQRMAANEGADIPPSEFEPIAAYLASEAGGGGGEGGLGGGATSIFGTVSAIWRSGNTSANGNTAPPPPPPPDGLQDTGFFPDVWVGLQWKGGPVTARAQVCTSCHNPAQEGMNFELVDATVGLDLMHALYGECYEGMLRANLEAGRFIAPFGAYAGMSHPGVYRTMTNPLMFLMGRTVGSGAPRPVLPQPYSDEGIRLNGSVPLYGDVNLTADVYAVNGLQVGTTLFNNSRSYTDNNNDPAVGGRLTVGSSMLRVGTSIMTGHLNDDLRPSQNYKIYGGDIVFRYEELVRAYFEYAMRSSDDTGPQLRSHTYGTVAEVEAYVLPRASLLARYDTLNSRGPVGNADTDRFTWGVNLHLPGGSEFLINHERWHVPAGTDVDVVGFRWFASF